MWRLHFSSSCCATTNSNTSTSFTMRVISALTLILLPAVVWGQTDPAWTVTCNRDSLTITATADTDDLVSRLGLSVDTDDQTQAGDDVTGCSTALTLGPTCADTAGTGDGCESTLVVDLTVEPVADIFSNPDTANCMANTKDTTDPTQTTFTKIVQWRKSLQIVTDPGDNTVEDSLTNELRTYTVKCTLTHTQDGVEETSQILIEALNTIEGPDMTILPPVITFGVVSADDLDTAITNPKLGDTVRLRLSFENQNGPNGEAINYWQHLVTTKCVASTSDNIDLEAVENIVLLQDRCPPADYEIDGKQIITSLAYVTADNGDGEEETKRMNLDFKAFRIGTVQQLYIKCSFTICPTEHIDPACTLPTIDTGTPDTCSYTAPFQRSRYYKHLMLHGSRSDAPESFTSQLSTVIVLQPDNIIVSPDGQAAAGYTCLTTSTFSVLLSVLSLLVLVSLAVTITTCLQRRGGKPRDMDLPITYTNYAVTGSKS